FCPGLDRRPSEQAQTPGYMYPATSTIHTASLVGRGQLATLGFHHPVHSIGCLVPHRLGNRGRFFRPPSFRHDQRIDEFLLYVGKLRRARARWRDLRPDAELYDCPADLVQSAWFGDVTDRAFDPALVQANEGTIVRPQ